LDRRNASTDLLVRGGSWPASQDRVLLNPTTVGTSRYRYRGAAIPAPWPAA
jgi:RNA-directed DNA polymerase